MSFRLRSAYVIDLFESSFRLNPNQVFFSHVAPNGQKQDFSYRQTRFIASALARKLQSEGVGTGDTVIVDLPNCPEYIFLILAAAYGEFTLGMIDHDLSDSEKLSHALSLERDSKRVAMRIDSSAIKRLIGRAATLLSHNADDSAIIEAISGQVRWERSIMGERQDIIDDNIHFAERAAHLFDAGTRAVMLFSRRRKAGPSVSASPKSIPLTWNELVAQAQASNLALEQQSSRNWQDRLPLDSSNPASLSNKRNGALAARNSLRFDAQTDANRPSTAWQCAMPLSSISGFQLVVSSVIARQPFLLYETFDAERVLNDSENPIVTHLAVNDSMLQDLLTVEEWRADIDPDARVRLAQYQCILLVGHSLNARSIERALDMNARIFASYGLPEAAGVVATSQVGADFRGGMKLLDGYEARIVDANEDGFGRLSIKGPSVFSGYINSSTPFTVDHFFMTGEIAALYDGSIYVRNKAATMFISGGENVYPTEIADVIRHVPGVGGVHVFGIADAKLGKRPIAIVERSDDSLTVNTILETVRKWMPDSDIAIFFHIVDSLPRNEFGKIDRARAEAAFKSTIRIKEIVLHRVHLPFKNPLRSAYGTLTYKDSVIVEARDSLGRVGLGECVAFDGGWGRTENLSDDLAFLQDVLAPAVVDVPLRHPRDLASILAATAHSESHPMATSAIDSAVWDLYSQAIEQPFWKVLNTEYDKLLATYGLSEMRLTEMGGEAASFAFINGKCATVNASATIGLDSPSIVMAKAHAAIAAGYKRIKLKITPKQGFASARSVRKTFPNLLITLDANRSFSENELDQLKAYDGLNIGWIEEPFVVREGENAIAKLSEMQQFVATPFCADESYFDARSADAILSYPNIRCISVKPPRFGSILTTLAFIAIAKAQGKTVCLGDMYDSGISRNVNAALETLPDMVVPGDIASVSRTFEESVIAPPFEAVAGCITLNQAPHSNGIGCTLDRGALEKVEVACQSVRCG